MKSLDKKIKISENKKKYYLLNKEKILKQRKEYRDNLKNKKIIYERNKKYTSKEDVKLRLKEYQKEYYKKRYSNPEIKKTISIKNKEYRSIEKNKIKLALKDKEYRKNKRQFDIKFKILTNLRSRVNSVFKSKYVTKDETTLKLLGCKADYAKKHIESQFKEGMSWNNYGKKGWHIDHIIPCSSFDLTDTEQQKKCFHYTNLQPLWWYENLTKSNKL